MDDKGGIESVHVSEETPNYIKTKLIEICKKSDGLWEPMIINGKATRSHPVIIPIYFVLNAGCDKEEGYYASNTIEKSLNKQFIYNDDQQSDYHVTNAIILRPISIINDGGFSDLNPKKKN